MTFHPDPPDPPPTSEPPHPKPTDPHAPPQEPQAAGGHWEGGHGEGGHGEGAAGGELRLFWPAVATWGTGAAVLGAPVAVGTGVAVCAGGLAATAAFRVRRGGGPVLIVMAVAALCAAVASAGVAARRWSVERGPLRALAERSASADLEVVLTGDPRRLPPRPGSVGPGLERSIHLVPARVEALSTPLDNLAGAPPVAPGALSGLPPGALNAALGVSPDGSAVLGTAGRRGVPGAMADVGGDSVRVGMRVPVLLLVQGKGWRGLLPGQRVALHGRVSPPKGDDLIAGVIVVRGPPRFLEDPPWPQTAAGAIRAGLRDAAAVLPPDARGLLPALVVGDVSELDPALVSDLRAAGLSHLTAVSGANLMIVVGAVLALARLARLRPRWAAVLGTVALIAFVIVARPSPSVLRAAVMAGVGLLALSAGRGRAGVPALFAAIIGLLLFEPELARSPGFVLSVAATAGILALGPPLSGRLSRRLPRFLAEAVAIPVAAQAGCLPVLLILDRPPGLASLPANLFAAPAVAPATILGAVAAVVSPAVPALAELVVRPAGVATGWIATVARATAGLPDTAPPWPSGLAGLAGLLLLVVVLLVAGRRTRRVVIVVLLAATTVTVSARLIEPGWPPSGWIMVSCDVGQGDATVLAAGRGSAVVVDAGPDPRPVDACLRRLGVRSIPLLLLTHAHADHVAGLAGALHDRAVGMALISPLAEPAEQAAQASATLAAHGIRAQHAAAGQVFTTGPLTLTIIWPPPTATSPTATSPTATPPSPAVAPLEPGGVSDPNGASVVMAASWAGSGVTALLGADVETESQRAIVSSGRLPRAHVLKVPHHGSRDQDSDFLAAIGARVAITSVGADNTYGHPAPATLNTLTATGARTFRTDRDGDIAVIGIDHHGGLAIARRGHDHDAPTTTLPPPTSQRPARAHTSTRLPPRAALSRTRIAC